MEEHAPIVVVGGGLAGLITAATAAGPHTESRLDVVVLEGTQPGGRARTDERNGFRLNQGAHAVYLGGALRRTLGELGIDPRGGPSGHQPQLGLARGCAVSPARLGAEALGEPAARSAGESPDREAAPCARARSIPHRSRSLTAAQWLDSLELQPEARQLVSLLVRTATYVDPDATADLGRCGGLAAADGGVARRPLHRRRLADARRRADRGVRSPRRQDRNQDPGSLGPHVGVGRRRHDGTGTWTAKAAVIAGLGPANASVVARRRLGLG